MPSYSFLSGERVQITDTSYEIFYSCRHRDTATRMLYSNSHNSCQICILFQQQSNPITLACSIKVDSQSQPDDYEQVYLIYQRIFGFWLVGSLRRISGCLADILAVTISPPCQILALGSKLSRGTIRLSYMKIFPIISMRNGEHNHRFDISAISTN